MTGLLLSEKLISRTYRLCGPGVTLGVHSRTAAVALLFAPLSASVEDRKQGMPA